MENHDSPEGIEIISDSLFGAKTKIQHDGVGQPTTVAADGQIDMWDGEKELYKAPPSRDLAMACER